MTKRISQRQLKELQQQQEELESYGRVLADVEAKYELSLEIYREMEVAYEQKKAKVYG